MMKRAKMLWAAAAATAAAVSIYSSHANAADFTWVSFAGGTYAWESAPNWGGAGFPSTASDTANVSGPVSGSNLNINIAGAVAVNSLTMGSTTPFATMIGGAGTLALDNGTNTATITIAGVGSNTINANLRLNSNVQVGTAS